MCEGRILPGAQYLRPFCYLRFIVAPRVIRDPVSMARNGPRGPSLKYDRAIPLCDRWVDSDLALGWLLGKILHATSLREAWFCGRKLRQVREGALWGTLLRETRGC